MATRHKLETETQELYEVRLEFHDAESIANLLARPEGFWVAEQFLSIPAEIRPEVSAFSSDLSTEYVNRRLLRQLLATPDLPAHIQQRARYELVVATFRGTHDFRAVDDVARIYLDESKNESEPALTELIHFKPIENHIETFSPATRYNSGLLVFCV